MPALIQFVGATPFGGFSTNATTSPSARVGTTPNADGSSTWVRWIVASAPRSSWKATSASRSRVVSTSPLQTTMRSSIPRAAKRMAPAVPERMVLDRVAQLQVAEATVGEVRLERVREVAEREHHLVDAMLGEPRELPLEERLIGDREERLRRRVGERSQPGALAADEDDRLHGTPPHGGGHGHGRWPPARSWWSLRGAVVVVVGVDRPARRVLARIAAVLVGDLVERGARLRRERHLRTLRQQVDRERLAVLLVVVGRVAGLLLPSTAQVSCTFWPLYWPDGQVSPLLHVVFLGPTGPGHCVWAAFAPPRSIESDDSPTRRSRRTCRGSRCCPPPTHEGVGVDQAVAVGVDAGVADLVRAVVRLLERGRRVEPLTADVDVEGGVPVVTGARWGLVGGAGRAAAGAVAATPHQDDRHDADDDDGGDGDVPTEGPAAPPLGLAVLGAHGGALVAGPGLGHGESQVTR